MALVQRLPRPCARVAGVGACAVARRARVHAPRDCRQIEQALAVRDRKEYGEFLSDSPFPSAADRRRDPHRATRRPLPHRIRNGRGGMGSVWRARRADGRFEGTVAIKFVHAYWLGQPEKSDSAARAECSAGWIIRISRASSMPGSSTIRSPTSCSSMSRVSRSTRIAIVFNLASRRESRCSRACLQRLATRTAISSFIAT